MSTLKVGDIKHESFTGTTQLKLDSAGRLLVGTTTQGTSGADELTVATTGSTGITIRSGTSNDGNLFFADGTSGNDTYRGFIQYEHSNNVFRFGTNSSEAMRIDSTGDIGLGTTTPNLTGYSSPVTSIGKSGNPYAVLELQGTQTSDGAMGLITGYNTSGSSRIATINWNRDGANNSGSLSFETANNGSLGERCRVTNDGLTFGGDTAAANALDDYEEGSFTLAVSAMTVSAHNENRYVKIGSLVYVTARVTFGSTGDGSRIVSMSGLPYTPLTSNSAQANVVAEHTFTNTSGGGLSDKAVAIVIESDGNLRFKLMSDQAQLIHNNVYNQSFRFSLTYTTT